MSFANKVVLITGAGSGIGKSIAQYFAKHSAKLSLLDINLENLKKVSIVCESYNKTKVLQSVVDITNDEDLKAVVDSTVDEFQGIDVLVNCAGIYDYGGILKSNVLDVHDRIMKVNLRAVLSVSHFAIPTLIANEGCIVNISSVFGRTVRPSELLYSVSKAAVTHLTKCLALELAAKGVRVNCVSPGFVKTDLLLNSFAQDKSDTIFKTNFDLLPLKHEMKTDEVAELVAFS